ncbi:alpha/beta hydrolase [Paenibacillus sp. J31TS4]|uniref:alpha/beta hydrolase n=1 Tax=Paenibacillus sp. J31TS4 TaxID=2807195 RepID=UPI0020BF3262|nr:alpha/beta hydrolase [Paenibacillus sp. J31TS4]
MAGEEWTWRCADGTGMHARLWPGKADTVRAVVGIVHGMGEHAGRYEHVADFLTGEGFAVLAFDQRGHGRTEGLRGHAPSYEALLEGIDRMLEEADKRFPGVPRFLYGHSMGGNVTLNYLLRRKPALTGAIVTGPWLKLAFDPPAGMVVIGRLLEKVYPRFLNNRPMNAEHLTSDPEMKKRYYGDPLGHGKISAGFYFGMRRAGEWALAHADELTVPLLVMHGGDDKVTSQAASRAFAERAGSLCTYVDWPGFRHELQNETRRAEVLGRMLEWLNGRLAAEGRV